MLSFDTTNCSAVCSCCYLHCVQNVTSDISSASLPAMDHLQPTASASGLPDMDHLQLTASASGLPDADHLQPTASASGLPDADHLQPTASSLSSVTKRNQRRNKRRRFSSCWLVSETLEVYCVCRRPYNGLAMIQCEECGEWYHCGCLKISEKICDQNVFSETDVEFKCGRSGCRSSDMIVKVCGTELIKEHDQLCLPWSVCPTTNVSNACDVAIVADSVKSDRTSSKSADTNVGSGLHETSPSVTTSTSDLTCEVYIDRMQHAEMAHMSTVDSTVSKSADTNVGSGLHETSPSVTTSTSDLTCEIYVARMQHAEMAHMSTVDSTEKNIMSVTHSSQIADHSYSQPADDAHRDLLSSDCMSDVLGCLVPESSYYECSPPNAAEFCIAPGVLNSLRVSDSRYLVKGQWEKVFADGLKQSNSACVLCFRSHTVCTVSKHRRSDKLFTATGYCKVPDCSVTFKLIMYDETTVHVHYAGDIRHPLCGQWARPIRGSERNSLRQVFAAGRKPYSVFVEKMKQKSGRELLAGNFDGIGMSKCVLRKISSECMHHMRLHPDIYQSLMKLKAEVDNDNVSSCGVHSFLQYISISPLTLHFWTENGVKLNHQLACCNPMFLDATGSVVRNIPNCKRILYYEVSICNPSGSGCIPVAAMLTSEHTVTAIAHCLQCFRDAEKRIYGFRHLTVPLLVKVDFSMALICALLTVFNKQKLDEYLKWAWDVVRQSTPAVVGPRSVIHVCLAHFIRSVRGHCAKLFKSGTEIVLYSISLMASACHLNDLGEIFSDLCIVLCSAHQTNSFKKSFCRLQSKITNYDVQQMNAESDVDADFDSEQIADAVGNEDYCLTRSPTSPFLCWASQIYSSAANSISAQKCNNCPANRFYNVALFEKIMKLYMPTLPLWSNVFVSVYLPAGNRSCRHVTSNVLLPRTTARQEQRFNILKNSMLCGRTTLRMDEFAHVLKDLFIATEKDFVVSYLRKRKKQTSTCNTVPVREMWAKRKKKPESLKNPKVGKYQQASTDGVKDLNAAVGCSAGIKSLRSRELDSDKITISMQHLRNTFRHVDGLQDAGYGQCVSGRSLPRFKAATRPFVQVLNIGDHWVCATNAFSNNKNHIFWYDSLHGTVSYQSVVQLTSLVRQHVESDCITVFRRLCAHQPPSSRLCGYFAVATALAVCHGIDPTGCEYDTEILVHVIDRHLTTGICDTVPVKHHSHADNISVNCFLKLHCVCHMPSATGSNIGPLMKCARCGNGFHVGCMSLTSQQLHRDDQTAWLGPCCEKPTSLVCIDVEAIDHDSSCEQ